MKIDCYLFKCGIEASSKMFFKLYCALQFREGIFLRYPNSKIALSLSFPSSENPKLFNPDIIWEETKERDGLWLKKAAPFAWYFNLTFSFSLFSWETIAVGLFNNSAQVCSMWFFSQPQSSYKSMSFSKKPNDRNSIIHESSASFMIEA